MAYLFDFNYSNPTQIVFGTHSFAKLGELIPPDARVLLLYGGGSIKRNGVYEQVTQALQDALGAPRAKLRVWITEVPKTNWSIGGVTVKDLGR